MDEALSSEVRETNKKIFDSIENFLKLFWNSYILNIIVLISKNAVLF